MINLNMLGDFRCIIKKINTDKIVYDTGIIKNMFLDSFFESLKTNQRIIDYCDIGTGTTKPHPAQTNLVNKIARSHPISSNTSYDVFVDTDLNLIKYATTYRFKFMNVGGQPITEIGLGYNNVLNTRALLANEDNELISPVLANDEYLDIYYRVWLTVPININPVSMKFKYTVGSTLIKEKDIDVIIKPRSKIIKEIGKWDQNSNLLISSYPVPNESHLIRHIDRYNQRLNLWGISYDADEDIYLLNVSTDILEQNVPNKTVKSFYIATGLGYWAIELDPAMEDGIKNSFYFSLGFKIERYKGNFNRFLQGTTI